MKKLVLSLIAIAIFSSVANAYTIGGAYASLESCTWGQYGYEYGNIGIYNVNGKMYQVFFGSNYCEY
ncbi:MAG TPA: hypothetical protein EYP35_02600 [Desulfobacterales bacterium]|nr:hypothetical protein [Desulfobacterales bacterium]